MVSRSPWSCQRMAHCALLTCFFCSKMYMYGVGMHLALPEAACHSHQPTQGLWRKELPNLAPATHCKDYALKRLKRQAGFTRCLLAAGHNWDLEKRKRRETWDWQIQSVWHFACSVRAWSVPQIKEGGRQGRSFSCFLSPEKAQCLIQEGLPRWTSEETRREKTPHTHYQLHQGSRIWHPSEVQSLLVPRANWTLPQRFLQGALQKC